MPKFPNRQELYRLLQRELPEKVYPDGPPSGYYSTADMDSVADVAATGYVASERIYENYWPQTADERIGDWEILAYGYLLDASLPLNVRRERVIAKMRSRRGTTKTDIMEVVYSVIGYDKLIDIVEWGCSDGGWIINESELDISTILNGARLTDVTGPLICEDDPAAHGKTPEEWAIMQEEAYTYQVNIYDYVLTNEERIALDQALSEAELARSQHVIVDGLNPDDMIGGTL